jgi:ActR/RegA family two-component response regulator
VDQTVLVCEDFGPTLRSMARQVRRYFRPRTCGSYAESVKAIDELSVPPRAIITDLRFRDEAGDGLELIERLDARYPATACVVVSGLRLGPLEFDRIDRFRCRFLMKPNITEGVERFLVELTVGESRLLLDEEMLRRELVDFASALQLSRKQAELLTEIVRNADGESARVGMGVNSNTFKSRVRLLLRRSGFPNTKALRTAILERARGRAR